MSDTTDPALLERAVFSTASFNERILDAIQDDFAGALARKMTHIPVSLDTLETLFNALSGTNAMMKKLYLDNAPLDVEVEKLLHSLPTE